MKTIRAVLVWAVAFFAIAAAQEMARAHTAAGTRHDHPPIATFAQIPQESLAFSPGGKFLAVLKKTDERASVYVYDLERHRDAPRRIDVEGLAYGMVYWASDERLLVPVMTHLVAVDPDGSNQKTLMHAVDSGHLSFIRSVVFDTLPKDPDHVLVIVPELFGRSVWIYRLNVNTGASKLHAVGNSNTRYWGVDKDGKVRLRMDINGGFQYIYWRDEIPSSKRLNRTSALGFGEVPDDIYDPRDTPRNSRDEIFEQTSGGDRPRRIGSFDHEWQLMDRREYGQDDWLQIFGLSDRPQELFVAARKDRDVKGAYRFDLSTRTLNETIFEHPTRDVYGVVYDWRTREPGGAVVIDDTLVFDHFDPARAKLQQQIDRTLGHAANNIIVAVSEDQSRLLISSEGPQHPKKFYVLDTARKSMEPVLDAYVGLRSNHLGKVEAIEYDAPDGLPIKAYVTFPPSGQRKGLPLVVLPHGGPASRDFMRFHYWAQFLANRGYLVLQPNFRGSSGYGKSFERAGDGEWGLAAQEDITEGVRELIRKGRADPARVCVVGGSYGGYAALMEAHRHPEIYKCAASFAGISDLIYMIKSEKGDLKQRYLKTILGDRRSDSDRLKATSPYNNAGSYKVPLLLMHGTNDRSVSYKQSEKFAKALKRKRKDVRFVTLEGGDHQLMKYEHRYRVLQELEAFLETHIGPDK